jgi:hypothetical protein
VPNALAHESSPYLRQHAHNPVDWLPWGSEALTRAREREVPLLVSIGYSSCHWCHVMERESFEDDRVAQLMNERFVCVKVDREERPDVDAIYIDAVQAMTGQAGWPLNVFITPDQVPFYGGTYFPPAPARGMPSWTQVLEAISQEWEQRREEISAGAERIKQHLAGGAVLVGAQAPPDPASLERAVAGLAESFDARNGGFGGAPKFPQAPVLELLLAEGALGNERAASMAIETLEAIAAGGIHDQLGGGFHRYSVDATWTVPHFEKMLYDNALLARALLRAYKLSGRPQLLSASLAALSWALREMRGPEGGFYAALDADSSGVEGAFYVWTETELRDALGADADAAIAWFGITVQGNFLDPHHPAPGLNVLRDMGERSRPDAATQARIRALLLERRSRRERPGLDDKRLAAWNALLISALAEAGATLRLLAPEALPGSAAAESPAALAARLLDAASDCAELLLTRMRDERGRLLRTFDGAVAKLPAYLEDHGFLLEALVSLYEATGRERWLDAARELATDTIARFADDQRGGFFSTAADGEALLARRKDIDDSPIPAGASSAALALLRLHALTGEREYAQRAAGVVALVQELAPQHPSAFGHVLQAMRLLDSPPLEIAIVGPPGESRDELERVVRSRLLPNAVVAIGDGGATSVPLLEGRAPIDGVPAAYVCRDFACERPVRTATELAGLLDRS